MSQPGKDKRHESVIDQNLKKVYQEALDEGIPDRFKDLLDQLKQQEDPESKKK